MNRRRYFFLLFASINVAPVINFTAGKQFVQIEVLYHVASSVTFSSPPLLYPSSSPVPPLTTSSFISILFQSLAFYDFFFFVFPPHILFSFPFFSVCPPLLSYILTFIFSFLAHLVSSSPFPFSFLLTLSLVPSSSHLLQRRPEPLHGSQGIDSCGLLRQENVSTWVMSY